MDEQSGDARRKPMEDVASEPGQLQARAQDGSPRPTEAGRDTAIADLSERDSFWLDKVRREFVAGFRAMQGAGDAVTVYGSARVQAGSPVYRLAQEIGERLARAGFTVITGGGPGVMEAANRGAFDAGGRSVGLGITLRGSEPPNRYTTDAVLFRYFFVRKLMLVKYATAFVLMPGGLGTIDELFETLNLIQTGKVHRFPIILVGSAHWAGILDWLNARVLEGGFISRKDLDLFLIEDSAEAVVAAITQWRTTHDMAGVQSQAITRPRASLD